MSLYHIFHNINKENDEWIANFDKFMSICYSNIRSGRIIYENRWFVED